MVGVKVATDEVNSTYPSGKKVVVEYAYTASTPTTVTLDNVVCDACAGFDLLHRSYKEKKEKKVSEWVDKKRKKLWRGQR
jgi:hypothetical protein